MDRVEAVILGMLSKLRNPVGRTKFVKLVYLADNLRAEHLGDSLTGLSYCWDYYGPNASGSELRTALDRLGERGMVHLTRRLTPYENYEFRYAVTERVHPEDLPLSTDDWMFIGAVVKEYGGKPRAAVVSASKATLPMQGAKQFQTLEWKKNPEIERRHQRVLSNADLMNQIDESLHLKEKGVKGLSLEELRLRLAE